MDSRGRGGDGGNRENEQGGASSSQAATQEESLPSYSLHQSKQSARPSFPPPRPPRRASPPLPPPMAIPTPADFLFDSDYHDYNARINLQPSPLAPLHSVQRNFPAAREEQQQMQGALKRTERNPAVNSQQISPVQSDSSQTAREEPITNLQQQLEPSNERKRRRLSFTDDIAAQMGNQIEAQQGTSSERTEGNSNDDMDL